MLCFYPLPLTLSPSCLLPFLQPAASSSRSESSLSDRLTGRFLSDLDPFQGGLPLFVCFPLLWKTCFSGGSPRTPVMASAFLEPTFLRSPHELKYPLSTCTVEAGGTGAGPWPLHVGIMGWRRTWARQQGIAGAVTLGRQTRLSSSGRSGQTVPGGQTAQGKRPQRGRGLEERSVVGSSLGEILFYAEGS